jgi:hypothetical protein
MLPALVYFGWKPTVKSVARAGVESKAVVNIGKLEFGLVVWVASKLSFGEGWIVREDLLACKLLNKYNLFSNQK